jgi:hypothetical protein
MVTAKTPTMTNATINFVFMCSFHLANYTICSEW